MEPKWRRYLRFWRRSVERDVDDELAFHFEERVSELTSRGLTLDAARAQALTEFGDVESIRSGLREIDGRIEKRQQRADRLDSVLQDVRYAARALRRAPALTITIVATLTLGVGANAAIFSFLDRVLVRQPTGVVRPSEVRRLYRTFRMAVGGTQFANNFNYPEVAAVRTALDRLAITTAYLTDSVRVGNGSGASALAAYVDRDYFPVIGAHPAFGRLFAADEERIDSPVPVAVVSYDFWDKHLGHEAAAVGQTLRLSGQPFTIIGVAPQNFAGVDLTATDVWVPLGNLRGPLYGNQSWYQTHYFYALRVLARPLPTTLPAAIDGRATVALRQTLRDDPNNGQDTTALVRSGSLVVAQGPTQQQQELTIANRLAGVAILVLLIGCANVTNLLLARAAQRRREVGVRLALGISRSRLLRLLLAESALVSLVAAAVALVVGVWAGALLRSLLLPGTRWIGAVIDWRLTLFTLGIAIVAGAAIGLVPALQASHTDVVGALKAGAREGVYQRSRLRSGLLVGQAALSVVLLVGAGLFVRSLRNVQAIDIGYDADRLVFASVSFDEESKERNEQVMRAMPRIAERLAAVPGVERIALTSLAPMRGFSFLPLFVRDGDSLQSLSGTATSGSRRLSGNRFPTFSAVSPDFFATTGIRILRGRALLDVDRGGAPPVVVVNETMARLLWPGTNALGECLVIGKRTNPCYTVVGVARDAHRDEIIQEPMPMYYLAFAQVPEEGWGPFVAILRVAPERAAAVITATRRELTAALPGGFPRVNRMTTYLDPGLRPWRLGATLFSVFGLLALVVAAVGVYSTISYVVGQRTHEFGVRVALGARIADVLRLVVGDGLRVVALGVVAGVVLALAAGRFVASLLYGTSPNDPIVLLAVAALLLLIGVAASLLPAWRASRVDPIQALRAE